jgi:hypothetical protein
VVDDAERRGRVTVLAGEPGPVEGQAPRLAVLDLPPEADDLLAAAFERVGDEGLADGHVATEPVKAVQSISDPPAAGSRHQGLEPEHLAPYPGRLWRMEAGGGNGGGLAVRPARRPAGPGADSREIQRTTHVRSTSSTRRSPVIRGLRGSG